MHICKHISSNCVGWNPKKVQFRRHCLLQNRFYFILFFNYFMFLFFRCFSTNFLKNFQKNRWYFSNNFGHMYLDWVKNKLPRRPMKSMQNVFQSAQQGLALFKVSNDLVIFCDILLNLAHSDFMENFRLLWTFKWNRK